MATSSKPNPTDQTRWRSGVKQTISHVATFGERSVKKAFDHVRETSGYTLAYHKGVKGNRVDVSRFSEDLKSTDFIPACEEMVQQLFCFKDKIESADKGFISLLKEASISLTEKKVTINFVALCNAGKSTLLNAILGDSFLPMSNSLETSVKVTVIHDSKIHQKSCIHESFTKKCPILRVINSEGTATNPETVQGVQNICNRIKDENKRQRMDRPHSVPEFHLKVNIPFLAGMIPEGWTVCLVDIPGFGEANKKITQVTMVSVQGSSGYVFVTATGNPGQLNETDIFEVFERKGILNSNSLIIALTKSDEFHSPKYQSCLPGETKSSLEDVKASICRHVKAATKSRCCVSPTDIVSVSGRWGFRSSYLGSCCFAEESTYYQERLGFARECVGETAEFACGQGNKQHDLEKLSPSEVIETLDAVSGMNDLRARITSMVCSCRKMWADNLLSNFCSLSAAYTAFYSQHRETLENELKDKKKTCETLSTELNDIQGIEVVIQAMLNKRETSEVWREMEEAYNEDTTKHYDTDALRECFKICKDKVEGLKIKSEKLLHSKELTPSRLEREIGNFITETEPSLEKNIDHLFQFNELNNTMVSSITRSEQQVLALSRRTKKFVTGEVQKSGQDKSDNHIKVKTFGNSAIVGNPPGLKEIRNALNIPAVKLNFFRGLMESIRKFFTRKEATYERHREMNRPYRKWDEDLDYIMDNILENMKRVCKEYFNDIRSGALKYFFGRYEQSVKQQMTVFNRKFSKPLSLKRQELEKMKQEIETLKAERAECSKVMNHMEKLQMNLTTAHKKFLASL